MCGRFTITVTIGIAERFGVTHCEIPDLPRYNIAPSQAIPVILRQEAGDRACVPMRWGLIPSWAKDPAAMRPAVNARAETLDSRPSFRTSLINRRCLIPANGFYEWKKSGKVTSPYYIHRKDEELFAFAGLYDLWRSPDGELIRTCVIITTPPNLLVSRYHDRMPAILSPDEEARWVDPRPLSEHERRMLLVPYPDDLLEAYPVSSAVNSPCNEGQNLIVRREHGTLPV
mgnify:CR=1 FL=1